MACGTPLYDDKQTDILKHLPAGFTQHALNYFAVNSPPYRTTLDNMNYRAVGTRLQLDQITGHQLYIVYGLAAN